MGGCGCPAAAPAWLQLSGDRPRRVSTCTSNICLRCVRTPGTQAGCWPPVTRLRLAGLHRNPTEGGARHALHRDAHHSMILPRLAGFEYRIVAAHATARGLAAPAEAPPRPGRKTRHGAGRRAVKAGERQVLTDRMVDNDG